ncbi:type 2C protein phosphatase [Martiniozyma asiatica (nom. inval.)]|nr:type 2C protein phosphatase [Martiniozyma asiatica]
MSSNPKLSFSVGVAETTNSPHRRTMEDVHTYVANFAERLDWGYFGVFDGHAGVGVSRWCGAHLHELLYDTMLKNPTEDFRDTLNICFLQADKIIAKEVKQGGSTAAVAVLRWEEELIDEEGVMTPSTAMPVVPDAIINEKENNDDGYTTTTTTTNNNNNNTTDNEIDNKDDSNNYNEHSGNNKITHNNKQKESKFDFIPTSKHKRMLYTANVGDAKLVLGRAGKALCLSYEHKGTDKPEIKRIYRKGGLVLGGRVNGVLAVTRSLGDTYLKDYVIGAPYTTCTEITKDDEFLIIACDGLWDVCSDDKAVELVKQVIVAGGGSKKASKTLMEYAVKNGTMDNVTVMVIILKMPPVED